MTEKIIRIKIKSLIHFDSQIYGYETCITNINPGKQSEINFPGLNQFLEIETDRVYQNFNFTFLRPPFLFLIGRLLCLKLRTLYPDVLAQIRNL